MSIKTVKDAATQALRDVESVIEQVKRSELSPLEGYTQVLDLIVVNEEHSEEYLADKQKKRK